MNSKNEMLRKLSQAFMWTMATKFALGTMMKISTTKNGSSTSMNEQQQNRSTTRKKDEKQKKKMCMETMRNDTLEHQIIFFNLFQR